MNKIKFRKECPTAEQTSVLKMKKDLEAALTPLGCNYSSFGARKVGETSDGLVLQFIAVSEGIKRDGSTIQVKGIDLTGIQSNPVFMFGHNYTQPPIGRIIGFKKSTVPNLGKVLKVDVTQLRTKTDTEHSRFADSIFQMYLDGDLRTVSFGWRTIEADPLKDENGYHTGWDFRKTDAMEVSAVPIPADKDALITNIQQRGLDPEKFVISRSAPDVYEVRESIPEGFEFVAGEETEVEDIVLRANDPVVVETLTEEDASGSGSSFRLTAVTTPDVLIDTSETKDTDKDAFLEKVMARFEALEERLEDISDSRIGASLNSANRKALTDAVTLISAVLKNAGEPVAAATSTAATPEIAPIVVEEREAEAEVTFEDIDDIHKAMQSRRAVSAVEGILNAMALKAKSRSDGRSA